MNHDELLAKIEKNEADMCSLIVMDDDKCEPIHEIYDALRAVVELHKPIEEEGKLWCKHEACYSHIEFLERTDCECAYPCPTIQAIEKELS